MVDSNTIKNILEKYEKGEITIEEANAQLPSLGIEGISFDANANKITDTEARDTTISGDMKTINGYILLDTGTGYYNKVKVVNNELVNTDIGVMDGFAYIGNLMWEVNGNKIGKFKGVRKNK